MLDIPPKYIVSGSGLLDFTKKLVEKGTTVGKKVINSTAAKNLKRAADSSIGKEIQKQVLAGVAKGTQEATENALTQFGLSKKKRKKKKGNGIVLD